ncbi:hypothetical protein NXS19_005525 [Fusarium pseudograminearum]|nr:hypothetical protein NXS19_005525 [Fusarium pseudograminearum]
MKQRFSSLDVKIIAHELQERLVTLRLSNVYDLSSKILLLKFAKPDNKKQLVIDTGFRCHLTKFARTTAAAPSIFVARLRKFLKTRRLTAVRQVGTDRVLEFEFSDGQYRMFLEFFASGNIILTDADLNILALARTVSEGEGQEPQRQRVQNALKAAVEKAAADATSSKKQKGKPGGDLRKSLAVSITELPPVLVDHWLHTNNFDTTVKPHEVLANEILLDELVKSLQEARKIVEELTSSETCTGYIFAKRRERPEGTEVDEETKTKRDNLLYDDFHPFIPYKLKNDPAIEVLEFEGYNETVDEFFSSLEGQRLESKLTEREATAKRKLEAAKNEQNKRIEGLQEAQSLNFRKAAAIEANVERVQEAMDAVNGLLNQGMDWVDVGKLVEREKKRHNPVADIIKLPLNLAENLITLELAEEEFEPEEDDPYETDDDDDDDSALGDDEGTSAAKGKQTNKALNVEINLGFSPWSNAREYFDQRKTAAVKEEKTQQQASRALKNAEQKITEDLKKGLKQEKALLQPIRKQMWFEKFTWFISSDGYLVIGGKDAQQNETIYKKYLRKGDIYCHADLHGASSVIIKNNPKTPDAPIPPATLSQAGSLAVCSSNAWDSKAGMPAWWVNADQVSKSAPTGEFLQAGSFMIRGKKNFLPPAQLLLGLGLAFRISEESKAKHVKHRLHDVDSAIGDEGSGAPQSAGMMGDADEPDAGHSDVPSDYEIEDEKHDEESRDNPLQAFKKGEGRNDEVEVADEGVSELKISDEATNEAPDQEAAEADENEEEEEEEEDRNEENEADEGEEPAKSEKETASKPADTGTQNNTPNASKKHPPSEVNEAKPRRLLQRATVGQKKAEAEAKAKADREAELAAAKERRRAQHQRQQKETAEHEEIRRVMMEEGVEMLDEDEASQMTVLDAIVGTPLPGDEILEIIPVCAPWNALGRYKYKAKLQPGATKKGKAVKEVLERWKAASTKKGVVDENARDKDRMWPREVELIKALKPEETYNVVPVGKVRVMMAGGGGGSGGNGGKKGAGGKGKRGGRGSKK